MTQPSSHIKRKEIFRNEEPGKVEGSRAETRDDGGLAVRVGRVLGFVEILKRPIFVERAFKEQ